MYKYNEDQFSLPTITPTSHNIKPNSITRGGILSIVKARKKQIQNRLLKTEHQIQSEPEEQTEHQSKLKKRLITQVPLYQHYRKESSHKTTTPLQNIKKRQSFSKRQEEDRPYPPIKPATLREKQQSFYYPKTRGQPQSLRAHDPGDPSQQNKDGTENSFKDSREENQRSAKFSRHKSVSIQQLFCNTPVNPKARNQQNTKELKDYLIQNNMFFAKINPIITLCIIKLNKLFIVDKKRMIYKRNQEINSFFIILQGKIKMANSETNFKKVCEAGQTIYEEVLFAKGMKKVALQTARAMQKTYMVEIKADNYLKMKEEMFKYGYKTHFTEMESLLKRNFIMKNWIRSQKSKF